LRDELHTVGDRKFAKMHLHRRVGILFACKDVRLEQCVLEKLGKANFLFGVGDTHKRAGWWLQTHHDGDSAGHVSFRGDGVPGPIRRIDQPTDEKRRGVGLRRASG